MGFKIMPVHPHVSGGLKKLFDFFKANNAAKDVLIGAVSFIAGGFVLDRILRRDQDEDKDE